MTKLCECTELLTGGDVTINLDNVDTLEKVEQQGRPGTKVTFVSGRYLLVQQTAKQLIDFANGARG